MTRPKGGLGRGLGAIIPTTDTAAGPGDADDGDARLEELPVDAITPNQYQPRQTFDEEDLVSLTESIRQLGVLQPVLVRRTGDSSYELIAGERRWRAAQRAGLTMVPAVIRELEDQDALEQALVENLHRSDLNAIEEAAAFQQLIDDFGLTQEQVAVRVGKSRSAVANGLRLFGLPAVVQRMIIDGTLSAGHGRALLGAPLDQQVDLAHDAIDGEWSVRSLEETVRELTTDEPGDEAELDEVDAVDESSQRSALSDPPPAALLELERLLADRLDTRVSVTLGASKGRMSIDFADLDDLERIYRLMIAD